MARYRRRASFWVLGVTNKCNVPGDLSIHLGRVDSVSACLAFPTSQTLTVIDDGTQDTMTVTWTPADAIEIHATTGDYPTLRSPLLGYAAAFVPASAPAWQVAFPNGVSMDHPVAAVPAEPCSP